MNKVYFTFGIDFDGTCVKDEFPNIGESIGAEKVLKKLTDAGHKLILFTCRVNNRDVNIIEGIPIKGGRYLSDAVEWFSKNKIPIYGINENPEIACMQRSPKPHCDFYIDDKAIGTPLIVNGIDKPFVDWGYMDKVLNMFY